MPPPLTMPGGVLGSTDVDADDLDEQAFLRWLDEPLPGHGDVDEVEQWMSTRGRSDKRPSSSICLGVGAETVRRRHLD